MNKMMIRTLIIAVPLAMTVSFASTSYAFFDNAVKINWSDVPAAAQNTITANINGGKVYEVEKENEDGNASYEIKAKTAGDEKMKLKVNESGKLTELKYSSKDEENVAWSAIPAAVQKTITAYSDGNNVGEIEKETKAGRSVYEVKVKTSDDHTIKMKVEENGQLRELQTGKFLF